MSPLRLKWIFTLPPGPKPPEALAKQSFKLKALVLEGMTAYKRSEISDIFQQFLGKEITFGQFYGVARAIQARYHRDGYLLSFAYVPPQTVKNGKFKIVVVEGYIDSVVIEGAKGQIRSILERSMAPITKSRPLKSAVLARPLLLGNELAGITATGVLQPSKKGRGASQLVVKVSHKPVDASLSVDNRGSEFVGPWRTTATAGVNSLLGLGERLAVNASVAVMPDELQSYGLNYSHPLGRQGLRIAAAVGYVSSQPAGDLTALDIDTNSYSGDLGLSYPLVLGREQSVKVKGGFSVLNTAVDSFDKPLFRDRIRTLSGRVSYRHSGFLGGGSGASIGVIQSVPIFHASDPADGGTSRSDADNAFTSFTFGLSRTQRLFGRVGLVMSATAQYARTPLPAAMEYSLGGARYGRAYDTGEITGEHGVAVSAELGYDLYFRDFFVKKVKPYGFYDYGKAWDDGTDSAVGLSRSLSSAGLGARVRLIYKASLDLEYAYPLTRTPSNQNGDKKGRFFVSLKARF